MTMKPIFNIFVFLLLFSPLLVISQAPPVDIASAQKKLDAVQLKGKGVFKTIDEKAVKLDNGDIITTSLCFCDSMPGASNPPYNYFSRRYGLTTKAGKKLDPLYDNIVYWEKDQYLVKYHDYTADSYNDENWYALVDRNFKVLQVYQEEGISYDAFYRLKKNGKYGAINGSLDEKLPFVYDSLSELSLTDNVHVLVKERSFYSYAAKGKNKWGLITTDSDTIVPFKYDFLSNTVNGNIIAKNKGKWGIISQEDTVVVPFIYDSIMGGSGYFLLKGKKWGSLPADMNYKKAVHQYDEFVLNPARGRGMARIGNKWHILSEGKIKETDTGYDGYHFDPESGPFIFLKKGDLYALYDIYKGFKSEFIYSQIVDVLYERETEGYTNYPLYRFKVIENGKEVEFTIRD